MTIAHKNFETLANQYEELVRQFIIQHDIREIYCYDNNEHFFDKIIRNNDDSLTIHKHGMTWKKLLFDFSLDYAKCLSNMEHELFLKTHNSQNTKYKFILN